jgi:hypothetical protein
MERRLPRLPLLIAVVTGAVLASSVPALAQSPDEKVNMVIVYGKDACPQPKGNEITVCARKDESERYRIPEELRGSESPKNDAWNNKVLAYEMVGKTGTLSCSPVGPGGFAGCARQMIDQAYAEKETAPSVRFSELIAAERARRLSTIDADAAATQARVEQEERAYEARHQAEQSGSAPAAPAPTTPPPSATAPDGQ